MSAELLATAGPIIANIAALAFYAWMVVTNKI
jgi:hypothetical protein